MKISRAKVGISALALILPLALGLTPQSAHAQETLYQKALYGQHNGNIVRPMAEANPMDAGTTTGGDPDYTDTFAGVTSEVQGAITGPGKLAIGVMILGVIFGVVWRLVSKAPKKIAGG